MEEHQDTVKRKREVDSLERSKKDAPMIENVTDNITEASKVETVETTLIISHFSFLKLDFE